EGVILSGGEFVADVINAGTLPTAFTMTDNSALFSFVAVIDGTTVDLNVDRQSLVTIVNAYKSGGVAGAAGVLDSMFDNGAPNADMQTLLSALSRLETEQEVVSAMNQLVPIVNGDAPLAIITSMHDVRNLVGARQRSGAGLNSGDETAADRNVWGKLYGSKADQDDDSGALGYDADTYGFIMGADIKPSSSYLLGAALGYSQTDIDGRNGQEADIDNFHGVLYGTFNMDERTDLNWIAGYGVHDTDTKRKISFMDTKAKGSYDSWSTHLGVNLERAYVIDEKTTLIPSVRADYAYVDSDSYTEKGAGALNLRVDDSDVDELIFGLDGVLERSLNEKSMLSLNLGIGYDALADQGSITSAWAAAPSAAFKTDGVDPSEFVYVGGFGITLGSDNDVQLDLRYDFEGRDNFTNQAVSFKVNKPF
ncbi:MAG: autotransporter outer membrane beta-barrel domain-containing protein, partial [Desulfuromonadales bacterium]|nr:autotransporter outer membrane beta-barrel domain-containing protein [Desulfuromonadales bacterium]